MAVANFSLTHDCQKVSEILQIIVKMLRKFAELVALKAENNFVATLILNRLWVLYWVSKYRNMVADKSLSYDDMELEFTNDHPNINDDRFNFIVRVLAEGNYDRIVEIGAYDLRRAAHYRLIFPNLEVVALDKLLNFSPPGVAFGVNYDKFSVTWFNENIGPRTLVIASGTLSYFRPDELKEFLKGLFEGGYDVALTELGSHFASEKSLKRSYSSFYHPYLSLLKDSGFVVRGYPHPNHSFSLNGMERREYLLATVA